MPKGYRMSVLAAALVLAPALVSAQPIQGGFSAVGLELGVFVPAIGPDDCCPGQNMARSSPGVAGFYERYLTRRLGIRLGAGSWNPKRNNVGDQTVRYVRAGADFIYKGRGEAVNAYIGAGAGVYRLRGRLDGPNGREETATKAGAALLLGGELFVLPTLSLTIEGRYHAIAQAGTFTPDGINLTVGFRKFF
jgi:Outer membrane protein beta-barrel domain